jgi:hypothetical protein
MELRVSRNRQLDRDLQASKLRIRGGGLGGYQGNKGKSQRLELISSSHLREEKGGGEGSYIHNELQSHQHSPNRFKKRKQRDQPMLSNDYVQKRLVDFHKCREGFDDQLRLRVRERYYCCWCWGHVAGMLTFLAPHQSSASVGRGAPYSRSRRRQRRKGKRDFRDDVAEAECDFLKACLDLIPFGRD